MAFRMTKQIREIDWPVSVQVPVDGGKTQEQEFTARFRLMTQADYDQALAKSKNDGEFISRFLVGWEGLLDDDEQPVPFSQDTLAELCAYPFIRVALTRAYNQAITGQAAKN